MERDLLELAEEPGLQIGPDPTSVTVATDRFTVVTWGKRGSVERIRIGDDNVAEALEEARAIGREHGLETMTWWLGELSTPTDAFDQLAELGLAPDDNFPGLTSFTIDHRPTGDPTLEVRRAETYEAFLTALEIDWEVWSLSEETRAERRANALRHWQLLSSDGRTTHHVAYLEGEPVGFGRAVFTDIAGILMGGSTLPSARGRGVYTSLVHARWDEAVERGTPRLAVSGGAMSAPILERLGFREIGQIRLLADRL